MESDRAKGLGSIRVDQVRNIWIHLYTSRFYTGRFGTTFYALVSDVGLG